MGQCLVHSGNFITKLYMDSLLDTKNQLGFIDVQHIKYHTDVSASFFF